MLIHNVRFGFATNSSALHSLAFLPDDVRKKTRDDYEPGEFGWDRFTLVSEEAKRAYLGTVLWQHLRGNMPEHIARLIQRKWIRNVPGEDDYVDHAGCYPIPSDFYHPGFPDSEFFKELRDFILQPGLAILGGNDNTEEVHSLSSYGDFKIPEAGDRELVCRKDQIHGYWTVFSRKDGTKIRFTFTNGKEMKVKPEKAYAPELVDVKITSACAKGCPYCYQDSKPDGDYGDYYLYSLTDALSDLKVFEAALGGGEPTSHPDFITIVSHLRESGIVPNFSTRSLDWLRDGKKWPSIVENCGKFAFSVETADEVSELLAVLRTNGIDTDKVGLQVILGVVDSWEFSKMLNIVSNEGISMTILGYKPVGRGKDIKTRYFENRTWWIDQIMEKKHYSPIGIDTVLANEFEKELKEAKVDPLLYELKEGKFSCYIDAVKMKIGPSSFCSEDQMQQLDPHKKFTEQIVEAFSKF